MEELVSQIATKYGLQPAQVNEIVGMVLGFMKQQMPGVGGQLEGLLGMLTGAAGQAGAGTGASGEAAAATDAEAAIKGIFG